MGTTESIIYTVPKRSVLKWKTIVISLICTNFTVHVKKHARWCCFSKLVHTWVKNNMGGVVLVTLSVLTLENGEQLQLALTNRNVMLQDLSHKMAAGIKLCISKFAIFLPAHDSLR